MPITSARKDKRALLARKEKLLEDIKNCERDVEQFRANISSNSYYEDEDSSDSEADFTITMDIGPSIADLKRQHSMLRTCLHATQELTSLQVLQSEVNVLAGEPTIEGEKPVSKEGTWREVTAECRVDLVPFSITFYQHQPHAKFAASSYRGLRVTPVKSAHESELSKSVLPGLTRPSDAVEVLKSYAVAHRSRRTTLAQLAKKFQNSLFMEPMSDGGYTLKCADLLEISWTLQNKWSPIAPFHHRLKFDLEYMDESYIKIIMQTHKQLSDPTVETDERTYLLSKIISTCLEAQGPTQKLYESMESDSDTEKLRKRRTTLDEVPEAPMTKKKKDEGVMAPPKTLPKKSRPKGKENAPENRKRGNPDEGVEAKRIKVDNANKKSSAENNEITKDSNAADDVNIEIGSTSKNSATKAKSMNTVKDNGANKTDGKNSAAKGKTSNVVTENTDKIDVKSSAAKTKSSNAIVDNATNKNDGKNNAAKVKSSNIVTDNASNKTESKTSATKAKKSNATAENAINKSDGKNSNKAKSSNATEQPKPDSGSSAGKKSSNVDNAKIKESNNNTAKPKGLNPNLTKEKVTTKNSTENTTKVKKTDKNTVKDGNDDKRMTKTSDLNSQIEKDKVKAKNLEENAKKVNENVKSNENTAEKTVKTKSKETENKIEGVKNKKNTEGRQNQNKDLNPQSNKVTKNTKATEKDAQVKNPNENVIQKSVVKSKSVARKDNIENKNVASTKKSVERPSVASAKNTDSTRKSIAKKDLIKKNDVPKSIEKIKKTIDKQLKNKLKNDEVRKSIGLKNLNKPKNIGSTGKENIGNKLNTKIPQIKLTTINEVKSKINPLRISPRKVPSKLKPQDSGKKEKVIQKPLTSIPRLMKKPSPKTIVT